MAGEQGMQYQKKSFTVPPPDTKAEKKCFKGDCKNEGEACKNCSLIQGKWMFYQQQISRIYGGCQ